MESLTGDSVETVKTVYVVRERTRYADGAIGSVVLALLWVGGIGSLAAIICGHVALKRCNEADAMNGVGLRGRELSWLGLILGYTGLLLSIVFVMLNH